MTKWKARLLGMECPLADATWLLAINQYGLTEIVKVHRIPYGGEFQTVFPDSPNPEQILHILQVFEYRHLRFIYDPWEHCYFDIRFSLFP